MSEWSEWDEGHKTDFGKCKELFLPDSYNSDACKPVKNASDLSWPQSET